MGLAALGAFLTRQPLKLALGDYRRGKRYSRTIWAECFALGYGAIALIGLILAIRSASAPFWLPIALAAPIALSQLLFDVRKQSRALVAELFGAVAISAPAAAIMMADGWPLSPALLAWLLLAIQSVTAIICPDSLAVGSQRTGAAYTGIPLARSCVGDCRWTRRTGMGWLAGVVRLRVIGAALLDGAVAAQPCHANATGRRARDSDEPHHSDQHCARLASSRISSPLILCRSGFAIALVNF